MMDTLRKIDEQLFLTVNSFSDSKWDYLFAWPTFLGEAYVALILAFIFMLIWDQKERLLYRYSLVAASALASGILVRVLKNLFLRDRPYTALYPLIEAGAVRVNCIFKMDMSRSFPSGHSATVFGLALMLNYIYGPRLRFLYVIAAWIAFSRMFVGAHFPADVVSGSLVGIAGSLLIIFLTKKFDIQPGGRLWPRKL